MICSKCGDKIKKYNAIIYRNKLYCKSCKPEKQIIEVVKEQPKEEPKKFVRKRLNKNKKRRS